MKTVFKWTRSPRQFQLDAVKAQLEKKDVLIHAGTGSGKTVVAAGPHAHPLAKGKVTIMVSPLIALQEEQVKTFENEFGLRAKAINSSHGGLSLRNMQEIRHGLWQIVVISPEMLLSKVFITQVIRHPDMLKRILGLVVDEAHKYGTLGILKALLPRGTPFVAMSATLPPRVRNDVLSKLQYDLRHFLDLNIENDRHNVSIIIRAMHHAMNTYRDLWFLIPAVLRSILDIKKAFVYADTIHVARDIEDYLYSLCPEAMRKEGFIRPYSAAFSVEYREAGCNIPDIDIVVQWKLPASFVQRAGRAARGSGRTGLAVLLVEKSSSDVSREVENEGKKKKSRKSKVREASTYPKPKSPKEYAELRGVLRGGHDKANDSTGNGKDIPLDLLVIDEGLYSFVQTGGCRRGVLTQVFRNEVPEPTVLCCDNCSPELLDRTRPAPPQTDKRSSNPKRGVPSEDVMEALHLWRVEIAKRDHSKALISGLGLLSDDLVELFVVAWSNRDGGGAREAGGSKMGVVREVQD
ncbi:P-loop containing nucleoside triphosphate hydrolase protein [Ephemerocybe angulata]|uniref:DNA 3'-5' helicase n=1 Tax=Ephemerocybe angulata TaxID=980116 RepID=A0A8H6I8D0_9AGAR|nr:P-loop containing nucleoside triphosphate hydrolase protein [Tulosesus angulatus]